MSAYPAPDFYRDAAGSFNLSYFIFNFFEILSVCAGMHEGNTNNIYPMKTLNHLDSSKMEKK